MLNGSVSVLYVHDSDVLFSFFSNVNGASFVGDQMKSSGRMNATKWTVCGLDFGETRATETIEPNCVRQRNTLCMLVVFVTDGCNGELIPWQSAGCHTTE